MFESEQINIEIPPAKTLSVVSEKSNENIKIVQEPPKKELKIDTMQS